MSFTLALAQFPVSEPGSWAEVEAQIGDWVGQAAASGARLLVFPEYAAMSLAALFPQAVRAELSAQVDALQTLREAYLALHRRLALRHGVYLLAGSYPWRLEDGRTVNRAWLLSPRGEAGYQDKQVMTRFEREHWGIASGYPLRVFETDLGRVGVCICYDIEFPLLARAQVEAGATLILAPSCTDTRAGYHRVRVGAQARALENQCYTAVAPLVGEAPWSAAIDINLGSAGLFGPPDLGFPADGVVVLGAADEPCWVYAEVNLDKVHAVRSQGAVFNHRHWTEQDRLPACQPLLL